MADSRPPPSRLASLAFSLGGTLMGALFAALILFGAERASVQFATVAVLPLLIYGIILLTLASVVYRQFLARTQLLQRARGPQIPPAAFALYSIGFTLVFLTATTIAFGEFCRRWFTLFGGFSARTTDYWSWVWYGVSWLLNTLTLGLSQAFSWPVTDIHPTDFLPRLFAFLFGLFVDYIALAATLFYLRQVRSSARS